MAGIQQLQQIKGFSASNFTEQDTVGPMPESRFQQVADRDGRRAVLLAAGLEPNEVLMGQLNLRRIFDKKDALIGGNELSKRCE